MAAYFGSSSTPADDGQSSTSPVDVTPPASMVAGQLVIMLGVTRAASATVTMSNTGGQTWSSGATHQRSTMSMRFFWCIYNGNWSANPAIAFSATTCTSVVMHVFSPTAGFLWLLTLASPELKANFDSVPSPFDVTIPTYTPTQTRTVTLYTWASNDENTWALQTSGILNAGNAQYRNESGSDLAISSARIINTNGIPNPAVTNRMTTLGGDEGMTHRFAFAEIQDAIIESTVSPPPAVVTMAQIVPFLGHTLLPGVGLVRLLELELFTPLEHTRNPATATLTFSGHAIQTPIHIGESVLTVSGQIPFMQTLRVITPPIPDLDYSGLPSLIPTLIEGTLVSPAQAALPLLSIQHEANEGGNIAFRSPGRASLTLEARAGLIHVIPDITVGALAAVGLAPTIEATHGLIEPEVGLIQIAPFPASTDFINIPFQWLNYDPGAVVQWS